jgi:uncharacterized membrane protein
MIIRMTESKPPDSAPLFSVRISPQRSLTPRGVALVLVVTAVLSALLSAPFVVLGAWPIAGFYGIDVLLLWLAFRIQARQADAYEEIVVTRPRLTVRDVSPQGRVREAAFNPYWVRLSRETHAEWGVERLSLTEGRRSLEIARHLGRGEKAEFANALQGGLDAARKDQG